MQTVGIEEYTDYLDYLEVHPEEFTQLFNTILINLTVSLRSETWDYLQNTVLPDILASKGSV
jgi:two-component system CheB/CheR fusion protein